MRKHNGKIQLGEDKVLQNAKYCEKSMQLSCDKDEAYRRGLENGFSIESVRSYMVDGHEDVEFWMKTPYTFDNQAVYAYSVVTGDRHFCLANGQFGYNTCEFYIDKNWDRHNLEDVNMGKEYCIDVPNENRQGVLYKELLDNVGLFASSAAANPHVYTYDEFVETRRPHFEKLGTEYITPESLENQFEQYLNSCKSHMEVGVKFIGDITKPENVFDRLSDLPSFKEGYDEWQKMSSNTYDIEKGII
ncbi:hypothetical protein J6A31_07390 [bacterium]|nr:hypothetical protein [bacterium]